MENLLNILRDAKKNGYQYVGTNADNDLMIEDVIADVNNSTDDNSQVMYQEIVNGNTIHIYVIDDSGSRSVEAIYILTK